MSLKSRKSIDRAGPDYHKEKTVSFRRESDNTYTKVITHTVRNWKDSQIKQSKDENIESGPYELSNEDEYDEKILYEDFDGSDKYLFFKLLTKK
jgi:hypothetical protein